MPIRGVQPSFDDLGTPLRDVTFCVVDLETTGGAPGESGITEIGAVKVRAGELIGEFQTLVNPSDPIPPFIAVLTGITDSMVALSPRIESVLPAFLEFAQGCVMVAHNAPFDMGFLKHESLVHGYDWPRLRRRRHRAAGAPGDHARRGAELQTRHAGEALPDHHDAEPPRLVGCPCDRRRAAWAVRTRRLARCADAGGSADVLLPGRAGRAREAAPGRNVAARTGCVSVHRRSRRGAVRRQVEGPADPGPVVLHRLRDPQPDRRDGRDRDRRPRDRVRDVARGRDPRTAADRGAQAAVQPAVEVPGAATLAEGHRRTVSPACRW